MWDLQGGKHTTCYYLIHFLSSCANLWGVEALTELIAVYLMGVYKLNQIETGAGMDPRDGQVTKTSLTRPFCAMFQTCHFVICKRCVRAAVSELSNSRETPRRNARVYIHTAPQ